MRLDFALESYLLQLAADGRSPHTRNQYNRHVRAFAMWLGPEHDLAAITTADVARFMVSPEALGNRSTATLNSLRTSLRAFFSFTHAAGLVAHNPARLLRLALRSPAPPRGLSDDEVDRLMTTLTLAQGACARRDHLLICVMLRAGLRLGSALALDEADVDLERRELRVRVAKRDAVEVVMFGGELADQFVGYLAERGDGPLFARGDGTRLGQRQAQRRIEIWLRRAGVNHGSAHSMRHVFALRLYQRTGDVLLVKEALRHRSIMSTLVYARPREVDLRRAIEA
jgi:integrase/recombinase XerC